MTNAVENINDFSERNKGKILAFNAIITVTLFFYLLHKLDNDGGSNSKKKLQRA